MRWLRKPSGDSLAVGMAGVKLADRLLVLGGGDPQLLAALAIKVGLTGRASVADADASRATEAARTAEREGALVEAVHAPSWKVPLDDESFDVAVVRDVLPAMSPSERAAVARELLRLLRPGGRCMVIDGTARSGLRALFPRASVDPQYTASGGAGPSLKTEGFVAVRTLAEREGQLFVEGVKRNQ